MKQYIITVIISMVIAMILCTVFSTVLYPDAPPWAVGMLGMILTVTGINALINISHE